jgi:hypothetical protein
MREVKRYRPSPLASSKWVEEFNNRQNVELRKAKEKFSWLVLILLINVGLIALLTIINW